ncbi:hypothetical protein FRC09_004317 [Ceratobasidium sp. 395]|nr:hypothetical protein FRC09_004317 [Ceratobasidium sp. 395]
MFLKRMFHKGKFPELQGANRDIALERLKEYDIQFLIDDSGSMIGPRWAEARDALIGLCKEALQHDTNGVEIYFLNASPAKSTFRSPDEITQLFDTVQPSATAPTFTGDRVEHILSAYMDRLEDARGFDQPTSIKPLNLIIITDGEPSDDPEDVIVAAARRLKAGNFEPTQVGIQFIQIGDDAKAKKALKKLDKDLKKKHDVWMVLKVGN